MSAVPKVFNRGQPTFDVIAGGLQPVRADLFNVLRARAERMSLRTLERRGFRNVHVLNMMTIENVVAEALTQLFERHTSVLSVEDRVRLEAEAKKEFTKLLGEYQDGAQKSDAERKREAAERQVQGLREELDRQKVLLDAELKKNDGSTLTLSPESLKQMEEKIRALFAQKLSLSEAGPNAIAGLSEVEREVAAFLDRLLQGERERILGSVRHGQSASVELLEKRILKLNKQLASTEDQLHRVAEMKVGDPGIGSIYDSIQGLSSIETNFQKKKELLEVIFNENLAIQKNRPRHRSDVVAAVPKYSAPRLVVPAGFEAPLDVLTEEVAI